MPGICFFRIGGYCYPYSLGLEKALGGESREHHKPGGPDCHTVS